MAILLSRGAISAPVPASVAAVEPDQSGHNSHVGDVARDELSTAGRSGYNSVETPARDVATANETGGRSGYNSIEVTGRNNAPNAGAAGRSGYNSVEVVERSLTTEAETDGRSGYN